MIINHKSIGRASICVAQGRKSSVASAGIPRLTCHKNAMKMVVLPCETGHPQAKALWP